MTGGDLKKWWVLWTRRLRGRSMTYFRFWYLTRKLPSAKCSYQGFSRVKVTSRLRSPDVERMTLTVNDSGIVLINDTRTIITHQFIKKNWAGKLWYLVFLHHWFSHCWSRKTKDLVLSDDDFMDLIYGVVDLIIGDAAFDISTIKSGSKLMMRLWNTRLAWGDFHARPRFACSTIPEEKWGTNRSLVKYTHTKYIVTTTKKTHTIWLENDNLRNKLLLVWKNSIPWKTNLQNWIRLIKDQQWKFKCHGRTKERKRAKKSELFTLYVDSPLPANCL